jgi:hypothetical protein
VRAYTTVLDRRRIAERSSDLRLKLDALAESVMEHEETARRLGVAERIADVEMDTEDGESVNEAIRTIVSRTRECERLSASMEYERPKSPPTTEKEWGLQEIVDNVRTNRTDRYTPRTWGDH